MLQSYSLLWFFLKIFRIGRSKRLFLFGFHDENNSLSLSPLFLNRSGSMGSFKLLSLLPLISTRCRSFVPRRLGPSLRLLALSKALTRLITSLLDILKRHTGGFPPLVVKQPSPTSTPHSHATFLRSPRSKSKGRGQRLGSLKFCPASRADFNIGTSGSSGTWLC